IAQSAASTAEAERAEISIVETPVEDETKPVQEPGELATDEMAMPTSEATETATEEPAKSEASAAPSAEPETEPSPSLTNSINGMVWSDANADGVKDEDEIGIAGYAVELYRGGEKIDSVVTKENGSYRFAGLTPGEYKVGVQARTLDGTEYLIPIKSIQTGEDNKFDADFTSDEEIAFTGAITMAEDTLTEHMDAGMRSNMEIMPMNATGAYVVTGDTTGTNYGTFNNIQTALNACPRYGYASNPEPCTITVMANDPDTGAGTTGGSANASGEIRNQRITITSGPGGPYTLTRAVGSSPESKENRHFIVTGTAANKSSLTLSNITLSGHGLTSGRKSSGGIQVVDYSSLIINAGTTITKCYQYAGNGMGVYISPGQNSMTMTGGTISNNYTGTSGSAIGNGGGVMLGDFVTGGITITGGNITNNSVGNDGGGVYVGKDTPFKMTGGSITGNTAGNDGGGIFSANSGYRDPANVNSYANLSITGSAVVSGNTSGRTEVPPANASIYTTRATNPFPGTLLNNDNISYRNYCYVTY
ncbi:MAG: SdrD B-like domain-containing protein, partial [Christensenella sp.]|uniref:SdrD B-like domain-containing protein n=1 Tax=Christensenella sp. TaxID=1935934 RepID=UPI002B20B9F3